MELRLSIKARLVLAIALTCGYSDAGSLRKIWEVNLNGAASTGGAAQGVSHVSALRFSPDGTKVAVVTGRIADSVGAVSSLFSISVAAPTAGIAQFPIVTPVYESGDNLLDFQWSADSTMIDVGGTIIHLLTGKLCTIPFTGGFLSGDKLVTQDPDDAKDWTKRYTSHFSAHFLIFDSTCQLTERWAIGEDWFLNDTDPGNGLLLVTHNIFGDYPQKSETLIVDGIGRRILTRLRSGEIMFPRFANRGQTVCGPMPDEADHDFVHCWNSEGGTEAGDATKVSGSIPFAAAQDGSKLIVSVFARFHIPFTNDYKDVLRRRLIWDFRTGKTVLSWQPKEQTYLEAGRAAPKTITEPFRFAISSDGTYLAEGGSGIIRLYRIEE